MSIITIEIKNLKGSVIFSHAAQNNTARKTVEKAVAAGVSLAYADLRDCNLSHAKCWHANFYGADFSEADFFGADFFGADFSESNLTNVDAFNADFTLACFLGATMF